MLDEKKLGTKVSEGRSKILYAIPMIYDKLYMVFKDSYMDRDRGNRIEANWTINKNIFEFFNKVCKYKTHYEMSPQSHIVIVKKAQTKLPYEVVIRRVATGKLIDYTDYKEGYYFNEPIVQFYTKDDMMLLDDSFVQYLIKEETRGFYNNIIEASREFFLQLEKAFARFKVQLIDLKLEYGLINNELTLIDDVTAESMRLWPYKRPRPVLKDNVLNEFNKEKGLGKDSYILGKPLSEILENLKEIRDITEKFKVS